MPITLYIADDFLARWLCQDSKPTLRQIIVVNAGSSGKMYAWTIDKELRGRA